MKTLQEFRESIDKKTPKQKKLDEVLYSPIRFGGTGWSIFSEVVSLNNQINEESDIREQNKMLSAQNVEISRMVEFLMAFQEFEDAQRKSRGINP